MTRTKVEVRGLEARHYDGFMNLVSLGWYSGFIRRAITAMGVQTGDKVLDMGAGTGRNALLMLSRAGEKGSVTGLEIGAEMQAQFRQKMQHQPNMHLEALRIEDELPWQQEFDHVLLSFVFHGFEVEDQARILSNARQVLKPGGVLHIIDYAEFDVPSAMWPVRVLVEKLECELAGEFIGRSLEEQLSGEGFIRYREHLFFRNYLRLASVTAP